MSLNPQYDVIVAGTGPAGSTIAKELSAQGRKILILEWGKSPKITGTFSQMVSMGAIPGKSLKLTNALIPIIRGVTLGGSSTLCYASAYPPPLPLFLRHGIDLHDALKEIAQEIPIAPLQDHLIGPMARRIKEAALKGGYPWKKLDKLIDQNRCRPACWRCSYGCPFHAKWSAGCFIDNALTNGAELKTGAKVVRVISNRGKAIGVEYVHSGIHYKAFAQKTVLSAGGLGSPEILQRSGIQHAGKELFIDPVIAVMGRIDNLLLRKGEVAGSEIPMVSGLLNDDAGYMLSDMALPPAIFKAFSLQAGQVSELKAHKKTLTIMVKAKDGQTGAVTKTGKVTKALSIYDKKKLKAGAESAHHILTLAGAQKVYQSRYFAAHPGGTVKINSVVDHRLETDIKNLYVCDASVIPEDWGLPPVLTLLCLGKWFSNQFA